VSLSCLWVGATYVSPRSTVIVLGGRLKNSTLGFLLLQPGRGHFVLVDVSLASHMILVTYKGSGKCGRADGQSGEYLPLQTGALLGPRCWPQSCPQYAG
jgi:hypothetical protein